MKDGTKWLLVIAFSVPGGACCTDALHGNRDGVKICTSTDEHEARV